MKNILAITLLLLYMYAGAQTEAAKATSTSTGFKRLYVGVSTTQGVGYRLLRENHTAIRADEPGFEYGIEARNKIEMPSYNYNVGLKLGINAARFLSFETGIEYSKKGYEAKQEKYGYFMTDGFGWPPGPLESADGLLNVHAIYHYIDIPFGAKFTIGKGKLKGIIGIGAYFNVLLEKKMRTIYKHEGESKLYVQNGNRYHNEFNVSPYLSAGIAYNINPSVVLHVMPIVQFQAMNNRNNLYSTMEYLYSGGINVALNFGFVNANAKTKQ
jgi:hypothetical protein